MTLKADICLVCFLELQPRSLLVNIRKTQGGAEGNTLHETRGQVSVACVAFFKTIRLALAASGHAVLLGMQHQCMTSQALEELRHPLV